MARGSVELSLNALIMFILSVMVLGAGIYLVGVFLEAGQNIIQSVPDSCQGALDLRNEPFALCPNVLPESGTFSSGTTYEVKYAFLNVGDGSNSDFAVGIDSTSAAKFEIEAISLYDVFESESKTGVFLIRKIPGGPDLDPSVEYVTIYICPDPDDDDEPECTPPYGPDNDDPRITRVLQINTR